MTTAKEIIDIMLEMQNNGQRQVLTRFFKTGKGEYGDVCAPLCNVGVVLLSFRTD